MVQTQTSWLAWRYLGLLWKVDPWVKTSERWSLTSSMLRQCSGTSDNIREPKVNSVQCQLLRDPYGLCVASVGLVESSHMTFLRRSCLIRTSAYILQRLCGPRPQSWELLERCNTTGAENPAIRAGKVCGLHKKTKVSVYLNISVWEYSIRRSRCSQKRWRLLSTKTPPTLWHRSHAQRGAKGIQVRVRSRNKCDDRSDTGLHTTFEG